jgi:hypothetical protein
MSGVPLSLRYSTTTEVTNNPLTEVDVVISGDKRRIDQINKNDLIVSVDISDVLPGERVIALTPQNVSLSLPSGVKLDEVLPGRIAVRLEAVEEKEITVIPQVVGDVPEGFEVYGQTVTPAKVRVRGPSSVVKTLEEVSTDKIDLTGHQIDFTARQIPINLSKVALLDSIVDVAFRIGEKRIDRTFYVTVENSKRRATVVVTGGRSIVAELKPSDVRVELDGEAPRVVLPADVEGKVTAQVRLR